MVAPPGARAGHPLARVGAPVDRRAAGQRKVGEGRSAVVGERAQQRIHAKDITERGGLDLVEGMAGSTQRGVAEHVVPVRVDELAGRALGLAGAGAIPGQDRAAQIDVAGPRHDEEPASVERLVVADRQVAQQAEGAGARLPQRSAFVRHVSAERAVHRDEHAGVRHCPAPVAGHVARDGAPPEPERAATIADGAALAAADRAERIPRLVVDDLRQGDDERAAIQVHARAADVDRRGAEIVRDVVAHHALEQFERADSAPQPAAEPCASAAYGEPVQRHGARREDVDDPVAIGHSLAPTHDRRLRVYDERLGDDAGIGARTGPASVDLDVVRDVEVAGQPPILVAPGPRQQVVARRQPDDVVTRQRVGLLDRAAKRAPVCRGRRMEARADSVSRSVVGEVEGSVDQEPRGAGRPSH